jgi:hypothetical protein
VNPIPLNHQETVDLDRDFLSRLYDSYGETQADNLLCDMLENIAILLARIERERRAGDLVALVESSELLSEQADHFGMVQLCEVATGVAACARRGDLPGLGGTLSRLSRVGDASLSVVWGPQDLSG